MSFVRDVVSGVKWSAFSRYGEQLIGFVVTAVLARLLAPDDFGLIALATVVTGLLVVLADFGTATALIQRDEVSRSLESTVFWSNLAMSALLAGAAWLAAPAIGLLFRQAEIAPVLQVLSLGLVFSGASAVPTALLSRRLAFDRLARVHLSAAVAGGAAGVALALAGFGVWSLVAQHLVRTGVDAIGVLLVSGVPGRHFSVRELRSVASFGVHLSGFNLVNFAARNVDTLLIGRFLGPTLLGYYDIAWRLIEYPKNALTAVVGRVMLPTYSRMKNDRGRFAIAFLRVVASIALVSVPVMLGLMLVAEPFVLLVFGSRWAPAALLVVILAPVGLAQSIGSTTGGVYLSMDRANWLFAWSVVAAAATVIGVGVGLRWGIVGVAVARLVTNSLLSPVNFAVALRMLGLRLLDLGRVLRPIAAAGLVMAAAVLLLLFGMEELGIESGLVVLAAAVVVGAAAYIGSLLWIRPPILYEILATLSMAGATWADPWMTRLRLVQK